MESGSKYFLFTVNDIPDLNLCLLMETIIEAKGIEKSFGKLKVLKGVGLTVAKSEVLAIMGASGAALYDFPGRYRV